MTDIVRIPFNGGEVLATDVDGKPQIFLRPAVEPLGINYSNQLRKLKGRSWGRVVTVTTQVPGDIQAREHATVDVRTFLMLLATIDEKRVSDEARPILIAYQSEVADAIEAYWTKGGAINSRATEDQLADLINRAEGQARVLQSLRGLVDGAWLEAKARHVAARALGEEPEIDPASRPLTVGEYLQDKGIKGSELRSVSTKLGVRVKGLYVGAHGRDPQKVDRFVDGALRSVYGYTEADRPLFDQAWQALRAPVT
jgi:hypothetical protein